MKFCPECGEDTKGSSKFCPECGMDLKKFISEMDSHTELSQIDEPSESIMDSTREVGNKLEDAVAKIFQSKGYEIVLRKKISGKSGEYNEIDVVATRGQATIAIECKNYSEGKKIGAMTVRDFIAKLDDLDIHQGLLVTNTDFSSDALGWAKNGTTKPIETWNGVTLQEKLMEVTIGRSKSRTVTVENCLPLHGSYEDYTILALQNSDKVHVNIANLIFHPFYIVSFNLHDRVKTPDRHIRTVSNTGKYYVDGLSGKILASHDESGSSSYSDTNEQKEVIQELMDIDPTLVEIAESPDYTITKHEASVSKKEAEFNTQNNIVEDNKADLPYEIKVSREEYKQKTFHYKPPMKAITTQSKIVYVPVWNIEFESKEYVYNKTIFPASDIATKNEIAECKHFMRKKQTFAVCDVCGIAKCEGDITADGSSYYCKDHIPEGAEQQKESLGSKFKKFKLRK
ncbi:MAG: restriction endonuclease [Nitrosopumilus sp. (ex Thoosa mismalolli)]|nr:restriction endonuclease [Nitrosopumilus sp. (ex Thoosa mismalolli)]